MVAIARAIGFKAKLVIMDEPTSSLDEREVDVLFDVIRQLKQSGISVIFVSHKLDELYEVCDRVTIMRDGRTVKTAEMKSISKIELVASMLGRDISQVSKSTPPPLAAARAKSAMSLLAGHAVSMPATRCKMFHFSVRRGEIVGLRRPSGCRAHRNGAPGLWR